MTFVRNVFAIGVLALIAIVLFVAYLQGCFTLAGSEQGAGSPVPPRGNVSDAGYVQPSSSAAVSYVTYRNDEYGFQLDVPSHWKGDVQGSSIVFGGPQGNDEYYTTVTVQLIKCAAEGGKYSTLEEVHTALKGQFAGGSDVKSRNDYGVLGLIPSAPQGDFRTLPNSWFSVEYTRSGETFGQDVRIVQSGCLFFVLMYTSPQNLYNLSDEHWVNALQTLRIGMRPVADGAGQTGQAGTQAVPRETGTALPATGASATAEPGGAGPAQPAAAPALPEYREVYRLSSAAVTLVTDGFAADASNVYVLVEDPSDRTTAVVAIPISGGSAKTLYTVGGSPSELVSHGEYLIFLDYVGQSRVGWLVWPKKGGNPTILQFGSFNEDPTSGWPVVPPAGNGIFGYRNRTDIKLQPDGSQICEAREEEIRSIDPDGGPPRTIADLKPLMRDFECQNLTVGLTGDDQNLYFTTPRGLYWVPLAGGAPQVLWKVTTPYIPSDGTIPLMDVAVDGTTVYWEHNNTVYSMPKAGGTAKSLYKLALVKLDVPEPVLDSGTGQVVRWITERQEEMDGLFAHWTGLYYMDGDDLMKLSLEGGEPVVVIDGSPWGFAISGDTLYTNTAVDGATGLVEVVVAVDLRK
ncbi:MAG: hypothetical protein HY678_01135 [Chloroflexi bacterium]|nr:hypothetical protein [Chloroflexota bacterium]